MKNNLGSSWFVKTFHVDTVMLFTLFCEEI